jgi:hypothetical protein
VSESGLRRAGEDAPLRLEPGDFTHQPPQDDRRCPLAPGIRLRAHAPFRTFFAPETVVEATDGQLVAGHHDERRAHPHRMTIPLGEPTAWFLACDLDALTALPRDDREVPARLVAYRTQDGPESLHLVQRALDGFGRWDRLVGHLRKQAAEAPQTVDRVHVPFDTATRSGHTRSVRDDDPPPDFL